MALDIEINKIVYAAKLLERALHDDGVWTMAWGEIEVPATRLLDSLGVTFSAVFPSACHLSPSDEVLLRCNGEVVSVRSIDFPGDASFTLLWRIDGEMVEAPA